jgi:DNA repair photolyase
VDALFDAWLTAHYPERRERVLNRIRETRGGRISDSHFGRRMRGQGEYAVQISALFDAAARRYGLDGGLPGLSTAGFRRPVRAGEQMRLL